MWENEASGVEEDDCEEENFHKEFNARLKKITDLLDGKVKLTPFNKPIDNSVEELFMLELKNLKNKVFTENNENFMNDKLLEENPKIFDNINKDKTGCLVGEIQNMDISEDIEIHENYYQTTKQVNRKVVLRNISSNDVMPHIIKSNDVSDTKWYNGTYFICKTCDNKFWNRKSFYTHLKNQHRVVRPTEQYLDFTSNFEELRYNCNICNTSVNYERDRIQQHLKRRHDMTIQEYEDSHTNTEPKNKCITKPFPDNSTTEENDKKTLFVPAPTKKNLKNSEQILDADKRHLPLNTSYRCPLAPCSFSCSKQGMRKQQGAVHLLQEHGVRPEDMLRAGGLRFTKIRGQE